MSNVLALVCSYNEWDILPYVLDHLHKQGVDSYVIDNWSTDGTYERLGSTAGVVGFERFPVAQPSNTYLWTEMLKRVAQVAQEKYQYDWYMHHDADEIRRSYKPDETLSQAFARLTSEGYNAVNFRVLNFHPIDNGYAGDPERYFKYHETFSHYDRMPHVKAWSNHTLVDLHTDGGHQVWFEGRVVDPRRFLIKHYPIRSQYHGIRKVFQQRVPRWDAVERYRKGWHVQYNGLTEAHNFLKCAKDLVEFNPEEHYA